MHWMGPYIIKDILDGGTVQLTKLNGEIFLGRINGSKMKAYMDDPALAK